MELEVFLALDDRQSNILRLKGTFPSLKDAKIIQLDSMYGSDTWVLKHIDKAMEQATKFLSLSFPTRKKK